MKALPESLGYNEVFDVVLSIWSVLEVKEGEKKIGLSCFHYMGILHFSQTLYQPWSHWTSLTPSQAPIISSDEISANNAAAFFNWEPCLFIYLFMGIAYLFCFSYFSGKKKLTSVFAFKTLEMLGCFLNASSGTGLTKTFCEDLLWLYSDRQQKFFIIIIGLSDSY